MPGKVTSGGNNQAPEQAHGGPPSLFSGDVRALDRLARDTGQLRQDEQLRPLAERLGGEVHDLHGDDLAGLRIDPEREPIRLVRQFAPYFGPSHSKSGANSSPSCALTSSNSPALTASCTTLITARAQKAASGAGARSRSPTRS